MDEIRGQEQVAAALVDIHDLLRYNGKWVEVIGYSRSETGGRVIELATGEEVEYSPDVLVTVQRTTTHHTQQLKLFLGLE